MELMISAAANVASNLKQHWVSLTGTGGTWVAAISANQEQFSWWTREIATIAAFVVSALTVIHIIKNWRNKK